MNKTILFSALAICAAFTTSCHKRADVTATYDVIPLPQEITVNAEEAGFHMTSGTVIIYTKGDEALKNDAELLRDYIEQLTGLKLDIKDNQRDKDAINLRANLESENPEGYVLTVDASQIDINGTTPAGTFYGIQTLRKSIPAEGDCNVIFPAATITDEPRFGYRGAHFDVSRHFFPADSVKSFIDVMALHNLNTLHWHLTDDQGWRLEIKSRPQLAEIASKRPRTVIGHNSGEYDNLPVEGYYTQDEVLDIIDYAAKRHITIIPEIDLPGHMQAALAAYPELGCTGGPYEVWQKWGISEDVLCAGNDSTYAFLDDVLGEVADLFPSEYVHIGGDECPKVRWQECEVCQAKIAELGLKTDTEGTKEQKLQSHVMKHASDFLASKGKKIIGWDEILEGGAAPGSVIMSWRGENGGIEAAKQGHDVIMTPNTYFYFDYYQTLDQDNEPDAIGGYVPLEKVYSYEPINEAFTEEEAAHILGAQANLWTEYIPTFNQALYMELPRMAALSEVQWSKAEKDYDAFLDRLTPLMKQYEVYGYPYSRRAFDIVPTVDVNDYDGTVSFTLVTPKNAPIHYTIDGTVPTEQSPLYEGPIAVSSDAVIKAVAFHPFGPSNMYADSLKFNKATAQKIELINEPAPRYAGNGAQTLIDGRLGGERYSSGGWLGFNGKDIEAIVDLGTPTDISDVSVRSCVNTGGWVFDARSMSVAVSNDGNSWTQVASEKYPALEEGSTGIIEHELTFAPVDAQYVKIKMEPEKSIPQWHAGKGKPAFLFIDEIVIN